MNSKSTCTNKVLKIIKILAAVILSIIVLAEIAVIVLANVGEGRYLEGFPLKIYEIASDSMYPELQIGDGVLVAEGGYDSLAEGDLITYYRSGTLVTHEVVSVADGQVVTKGVMNNALDPAIGEEDYIGKVVLRLPALSAFISYSASWVNKAILIALALVIFFGRPFVMWLLGKAERRHNKDTGETA